MSSNLLWLGDVRDLSTADAALIYAANGWPVFPLLGKFPPKELAADENDPNDRGGFHRATTDERQIRAWWTRWPNANIGWPLPSGLFALDEDPRHAGDFARAMLERVHGAFPMTLRQVTGSGGQHWIFRSPEGVAIHQRSGWWDGLDTRSAGRGYIIVEPSLHPEARKPYRWLATVEPVDSPAWLIDAVRVREVVRKSYVSPIVPSCAHLSRRKRLAVAVLAGVARKVAQACEGNRNDLLFWAWNRCNGYRDVLDRAEVERELFAAGTACGLGEREIRKVFR